PCSLSRSNITLFSLQADMALLDDHVEALRRYLWKNFDALQIGTSGNAKEKLAQFHVVSRKFAGGHSNPTFLLELSLGSPGRVELLPRLVLRKKPASVKVSSAHAVEREYRVLRALSASDVPVPEALLLCEDSTVLGTPFYVMRFVEGKVFTDPALPGLKAAQRWQAYAVTVETLARLHLADYHALGLATYARGGGAGYFARQLDTLARISRKQAEDAAGGELPGLAVAAAALGTFCDDVPDRISLVHGDFRLDNLVLAIGRNRGGSSGDTGVAVAAVLDWELSTLGHPMVDLASLALVHYLPHTPGAALPGLGGVEIAALGIPGEAELVSMYRAAFQRLSRQRRYRRSSLELTAATSASTAAEAAVTVAAAVAGAGAGSSESDDEALYGCFPFYLAFVCFKNAVIAQGVASRLARGVASSARAAEAAAMAPVILNLCERQLERLRERRRAEIRAVIFDVGGVLTVSPLAAIAAYERRAVPPLPPGYVGATVAAAGALGLFQRLETGQELLGPDFLRRFETELRSPAGRRAYTAAAKAAAGAPKAMMNAPTGPLSALAPATGGSSGKGGGGAAAGAAAGAGLEIDLSGFDAGQLFDCIIETTAWRVPEMWNALGVLRRHGLRVGVLSNDFASEPGFRTTLSPAPVEASAPATEAAAAAGRSSPAAGSSSNGGGSVRAVDGDAVYAALEPLCDAVVRSSREGTRKPERRAYEVACRRLGVLPSECVFVDDLRGNVLAARCVGRK
ncbi:unnamed protein product, partial [Phaeothamnion confervicola]